MSKRLSWQFAILILAAPVLLALPGCYPARRAEPVVGPISLADPALQRGRIVYDRHCYKCHTEGEGGLGPVLNDKPLPRFLMKLQIRTGLGVMPSFSREQISAEELDDLVNYIVALRRHR